MDNKPKTKPVVAVIGGHSCTKEVEQIAHKIGKIVAKMGAILVCGGLGGVMEAACKGASSQGGLTIGMLPGDSKVVANPYVSIGIPTGLGLARNVLVVKGADIVVAISGSYGTLSEIAYAMQYAKPVIGIKTWDIKGIIKVKTAEEAEQILKKFLAKEGEACQKEKI